MTPTDAVFDTNILFFGTGWRGSPYSCLQLACRGEVTLVTCRQIMAEFREKLQTKRGMTSSEATRVAAEILSFSRLVEIPNILKIVADDPDDDKVLECAVVGGSKYIVSGDHHLLELGF
ncbi:MAG: putative toxin-antitoxin system toxin component, PIN family [Anaerolineales bacterium]|nr:putative toxin-antitoxin system toxin component, PIN family [Anaerolineales bacterium]